MFLLNGRRHLAEGEVVGGSNPNTGRFASGVFCSSRVLLSFEVIEVQVI